MNKWFLGFIAIIYVVLVGCSKKTYEKSIMMINLCHLLQKV